MSQEENMWISMDNLYPLVEHIQPQHLDSIFTDISEIHSHLSLVQLKEASERAFHLTCKCLLFGLPDLAQTSSQLESLIDSRQTLEAQKTVCHFEDLLCEEIDQLFNFSEW